MFRVSRSQLKWDFPFTSTWLPYRKSQEMMREQVTQNTEEDIMIHLDSVNQKEMNLHWIVDVQFSSTRGSISLIRNDTVYQGLLDIVNNLTINYYIYTAGWLIRITLKWV